ncbi:MAG: hypothetical protein A2017_05775 [Lentisphaerae bacterium GWF2_44_16]|nr:MAG: hypothetical protein A2017_05775 [Lentisphaerae bacterium GWF2_44_16]
MTDNATLKKWSDIYGRQRSVGAPGWASADSYRLKQNRIVEALSEHQVLPDATFLELGCGAGNIALWMALRGFTAFGVDIIQKAIEWAADNAAEASLSAQFVMANAAEMPMFQNEQFDIIFDSDCFHMITGHNRAICFREVYRVLKSGGLMIAGGNVRDESLSGPTAKCIRTPDGLEYMLYSETELLQELSDAGFRVLCVKHHPKRGSNKIVRDCIAIHATR